MKTLILIFMTMASFSAVAASADNLWNGIAPKASAVQIADMGSHYDWARGNDGWGYCYQWTDSGQVLNQGAPVSDWNCEQNNPSYYNWGQGSDGWGYCYHYTPYGVPMNAGSPASNYMCEQRAPSYYSWGRGNDGYTRCYQFTANGIAMNQGAPVSNYYCQ